MLSFKKLLAVGAIAIAASAVTPASSDAAIFVRRFAPVRRVAARAVLPPYPIARRAVAGPVYRPYRYGAYYGGPAVYGPGVSVWW